MTRAQGTPSGWWTSPRVRTVGSVAAMLLGVLAVYCPPGLASPDRTLFGGDYFAIHIRRLRFAQDALFAAPSSLPGWYPREFLGTPFWSNIQNFPFTPVRWPLLLVDPWRALAAGANLAALLAALFTYLYCRRVGLTSLAATAAGWTFAGAGFFAARVMAGHLTLLETYPALPLLLWLAEVSLQSSASLESGERRTSRVGLTLLALGLATASVALAGHPQLPVYAMATTVVYLLYRGRGRRGLAALGAMALGLGVAGFALWPMWRLIQRSTRLLALGPAPNDIAFPAYRLGAFLFPWKDGWAPEVARAPATAFIGPNLGYFWDTVCYVGWMPLLAALGLGLALVRRRQWPAAPWGFFAAVGMTALLLASWTGPALVWLSPGTVLRSPARLLYLTTFALALALGVAVDRVRRSDHLARHRWAPGLLALGLVIHGLDLGLHDRAFIKLVPIASVERTEGELSGLAPDHRRVAMDFDLLTPLTWTRDNVGFFDSIALARVYRAMLELSGFSPRIHTQVINGSDLGRRALEYGGAAVLITKEVRRDLGEPRRVDPGLRVYRVSDPAPRADFVPLGSALLLDERETHRRLRDRSVDLRDTVMVPPRDYGLVSAPGQAVTSAALAYGRPSADEIVVSVTTETAGFLRIREAFDWGWTARADGAPVAIVPADDVVMAVPLGAGAHEVRLRFATPGLTTGLLISLVSLGLLVALATAAPSRPPAFLARFTMARPRPAPPPRQRSRRHRRRSPRGSTRL